MPAVATNSIHQDLRQDQVAKYALQATERRQREEENAARLQELHANSNYQYDSRSTQAVSLEISNAAQKMIPASEDPVNMVGATQLAAMAKYRIQNQDINQGLKYFDPNKRQLEASAAV